MSGEARCGEAGAESRDAPRTGLGVARLGFEHGGAGARVRPRRAREERLDVRRRVHRRRRQPLDLHAVRRVAHDLERPARALQVGEALTDGELNVVSWTKMRTPGWE